jgi:hypothetical protein
MPIKPALARSLVLPTTVILVSGMISSACGKDENVRGYNKPATSETEADATAEKPTQQEQQFDEIAHPPQEYYDSLFSETLRRADSQSLSLAETDQVLYVNFNGATLSKGFGRGQSFILCRQTASIPAAGLSPADQQAILDEVQRFYNEAGARLVVTAEKPQSGDFTTIHTGGSYRDLGCAGIGVLGVAPFDKGNANRNDIGFAFTSGVSSNRVIAETIAHEAAHSFGLDHVESRKDVMFASSTNQITGFTVSRINGSTRTQDGPAVLQAALGTGTATAGTVAANTGSAGAQTAPTGSTNPTPAIGAIPGLANLPGGLANLPGLTQIGNIGQLIPGLAQAGNFDISGLLAQALAVIPSNAGVGNLPQFDKILAAIGLSAQAGANQNPGAGQTPAGGLAGLAGSILGNSNLGGLASIASLAGLGNIGTAVGTAQTVINAISGISGQGAGQVGTPNLPAGLPDLSALLGLVGASTSPADIINNLAASAGIINGNFSGAQKDALLSLIKVGYSQAFNQIGASGGK